MAKPVMKVPPEKHEQYKKLIATRPDIDLKGATMPYTSLNGHMFSFINPDGVVGIRLSEKERDAFIAKYKSKLYDAYGTVLKEYVTVPEKLLEKTNELSTYMDKSFDYVATLKPKPDKKTVKK